MSTFSDDLSNVLLDDCENALGQGATIKDILISLSKVIQYLIEYRL